MASDKDFSIGQQIFGYRQGARQFQRTLTLNLPKVHSFDEPAAMACLKDMFAIAEDKVKSPENRSGKTPTAEEMAYLTAALSLSKSLLRVSGIPSFDREVITGFPANGATKQRMVTLDIPVVENTSSRFYESAHRAAFQLMTAFTQPISQRSGLKKKADALEDALIKPLRRVSNGRPLDVFVLREAFDRGIQVNHLGGAVYRLGIGVNGKLFSRSSTDGDSAIGFRTAQDKAITLNWLRQIGVPTPRSVLVPTAERACEVAREIGYPVVIKPADRDRSEGVVMDVMSDKEVPAAFDAAREWSDRTLVETRIPGVCHRLVTFQNTFVFAFTRHPKAVEGDGESTVKELVEAANQKRNKQATHVQNKVFPFDEDAMDCLREQGLTPNSIPEEDQIVLLRSVNSLDDGGHSETVTDKVHPENIWLAERISRHLRLESMGLDLISTDVTKPWFETGACITEVNAMPQIGENSARAYLERTFGDNNGYIPVHCFVGDAAAFDAANRFRAKLADAGTAAVLTSHDVSIGQEGEAIALTTSNSLFDRTMILQHDPQIEALILVIQDDELLFRGHPLRRITSMDVTNRAIKSFRNRQQSIEDAQIDLLLATIGANLAGSEPAPAPES